jgi:hypothetical protein
MKVYTCIDHDCHWPVGVASIIVALNEANAVELLKKALRECSLDAERPFTLNEVEMTHEQAIVLQDGNY